MPRDWAGELRAWVDGHDEIDTTAGLARHGWKLADTDTPTRRVPAPAGRGRVINPSYSFGLAMTDKG